jgi:hypothetical protein
MATSRKSGAVSADVRIACIDERWRGQRLVRV